MQKNRILVNLSWLFTILWRGPCIGSDAVPYQPLKFFWSGFDKFNCWRVRISKTRNYSEQKDYYYFSHPKPEKFIIFIYFKNRYNFQFSLSVILGSDITSIFTFTQFFNAVNFNLQVFWLSSVLFNLHLAQTWHKLTKSKSVLLMNWLSVLS